ncbi:MAG: hypothetical protein PHU35_01645, partial [Bacteroidales bacterium]|nr:hypothetical protein [Bacteroidales bacterium]
MNRLLTILLFFLVSLIGGSVFSQTYNMQTNGYSEIHTNSGILYDNGGNLGNYATRVNAKTTIFPLTPGTRIILNGTYNIEDHNRTKLIIYSGDTNSNLKLFENSISNSGNISVRSQLGPVTVVFLVDSDSPN